MMRILIVGSAGLLGSYLYRFGKKNGIGIMGLSRSESRYTDIRGDATNFEWLSQQVEKAKCDIVINTLKFKGSTDECEIKKKECWEANYLVPKKLASLQKELGFGLVQISTDWIFDGTESKRYSETDVPYPRNFYAFSKYAAELTVKACFKYMILRTTGLFGYEKPARNFMARFLESAKTEKQFEGATDQLSQPISALALSKIAIELIKRGGWNSVYHVTGPEYVSRFELAQKFAEYFRFPRDLVRPATSAARTIYIPRNVAMDIKRTEMALGRRIEDIEQMLKDLDAFEEGYV